MNKPLSMSHLANRVRLSHLQNFDKKIDAVMRSMYIADVVLERDYVEDVIEKVLLADPSAVYFIHSYACDKIRICFGLSIESVKTLLDECVKTIYHR